MSKEDREKWDAELNAPVPGYSSSSTSSTSTDEAAAMIRDLSE